MVLVDTFAFKGLANLKNSHRNTQNMPNSMAFSKFT